MNLNIYHIDYINDYGSMGYGKEAKYKSTPILRLFGRDENQNKIVKAIRGFKPYFYMEDGKEFPHHLSQYVSEISNELYEGIKGEKLRKIYTISPTSTRFITDELNRREIKTFEDDILYVLRFLIDEQENLEKNGIHLKSADSARRLYIDIETKISPDEFPDPKTAKEPITTVCTYDSYKKEYTVFAWHPDYDKIKDIHIDGINVLPYPNEEMMMRAFMQYYKKINPDMILGWNVVEFDVAYIINRLKNIGMNANDLSCGNGSVYMWPSEDGNWLNPQIPGVVLFDLMKYYKKINLNLKSSYSLDNISKEELGEGKVVVKDMDEEWRERPKRFIEYNIKDVELCIRIEEKRELVNFVDGLRFMTGCNYSDFHYFSRMVDLMTLRHAKQKNIVLPSKPRDYVYVSKDKRKAEFEGAVVYADTGIFNNVCALDLKTLYPNVIKSMNISYETVKNDDSGEIKIGSVTYDGKKIGLLPSLIDDLLMVSKGYKSKRNEAVRGSDDYKKYANLYECAKFVVCTLYGVQGSAAFRLYDVRNAASITRMGREIITLSKETIEKEGHKVVLIDTDSCYTQLLQSNLTPDECIAEGKRLSEILNERYNNFVSAKGTTKHYFEIEFEKFFQTILVGTKKRYAGHIIWSEGRFEEDFNITGFEAIKSNTPRQTRIMQERVLKMIVNEQKSYEDVKKYLIDIALDINKDKIKATDIGIPSAINQAEYENNLPKVRGLKWSNEKLHTNFVVGSKPLLVYVNCPRNETDSVLFEYDYQFEEAKEKYGIEIDKERTILRNIIMPLRATFEASGWNLNKLRDEILMRLSGQQTL